jgi:uncharacterized protein involved in exopolysaccharide biosynthesis
MSEGGASSPKRKEDEIDLVSVFANLWDHRKYILAGTALTALLGLVYALIATPVYNSQAILGLKEREGSDGGRLSQLGGVGGLFASQLGGGTSLDRLEVILRSRELASEVITENDLLPALYPKAWDWQRGEWKEKKTAPTVRNAAERLKGDMLRVTSDIKKGLITVSIDAADPVLAKRLVDYYLTGLNARVRSYAMANAEANRLYLEKQMARTVDPVLQEKISDLISYEIEKSMLASSTAFDVLEKPVVPLLRKSPKRKQILILSVLIGLVLSSAGVFAWRGVQGIRAALGRRAASRRA